MPRPGVDVLGIRCVEGEKEGDRAQGPKDQSHDREAGEEELQALTKPDAAAEYHAQHAVEQSVDEKGQEDRGRKFDRYVGRHLPAPPESDGQPVGGEAEDDECQTTTHRAPADLIQPAG